MDYGNTKRIRPDMDNFIVIHWDKFNQSYDEDNLPSRLYNRKVMDYKICTNCTKFGSYD